MKEKIWVEYFRNNFFGLFVQQKVSRRVAGHFRIVRKSPAELQEEIY